MSLIQEVKLRKLKKASQLAELGTRLATDLGEEAVDRAVVQRGGDTQVRIPALHIRPVVEERVSDLVAQLVKTKQIRPSDATALSKRLLAEAEPNVRREEDTAYRREAGERTVAPATLTGAAGTLGMYTGLQWLMDRAGHAMSSPKPGTVKGPPKTLGHAFKSVFMPAFLPVAAGFELGLNHMMAPMSDPRYKRGERGYWKSVGESYKGGIEGLGRGGAEARERYGVFGMPIQALHGVLNPLATLGYLGQQIGGVFKKPDIEQWAQEAAENRRQRLGLD